MFDNSSLLAAVRGLLPEQEQLVGKNNEWTVVSNKYIMHSSDSRWGHFERYTRVSQLFFHSESYISTFDKLQ